MAKTWGQQTRHIERDRKRREADRKRAARKRAGKARTAARRVRDWWW